jgi:hypothetical protein
MSITIVSRFRLAVVAGVLLVFSQLAPVAVSAQQPPPDITGSYYVSGVESVYNCTFTGMVTTVPFVAYLTITDQEGSAFSGTIGFPAQQTYYAEITGNVSSEGLIEGTWVFDPSVPDTDLSSDRNFTGEISNGKASIDLTAILGTEGVTCSFLISVSSNSVVLSWSAPDPNSTLSLPPPRALTAQEVAAPGGKADPVARPNDVDTRRDAQPTGYNVYRSKTPGVQTTPENLFASVPPTQTSVPAPDGSSGSFFVVTATYSSGESGPSNEVSGGVPAATLGPVKVKPAKIVATGSGFSPTVQVFVDGIPFVSAAKVKGGTKVTQKGNLITGQSLAQYLTSGKTVAITFRNENGGIATDVYTKP